MGAASRIQLRFSETAQEPIAWDSAGALFSCWSEGRSLWLARSTDAGVTWSKRLVVRNETPDTTALYFPYLAARGSGEIGMTWFSGLGPRVRANVSYARFDTTASTALAAGDSGLPHADEVFAFP